MTVISSKADFFRFYIFVQAIISRAVRKVINRIVQYISLHVIIYIYIRNQANKMHVKTRILLRLRLAKFF